MAGKFARNGKYESDEGTVYRIRVQPETISAANPLPAGEITGTGSVRVGGGNRQIGIKARSISLAWNPPAADPANPDAPEGDPDAPEGYEPTAIVRIPIFGASVWAALALGSTFTYLDKTATIIGKSPERVR